MAEDEGPSCWQGALQEEPALWEEVMVRVQYSHRVGRRGLAACGAARLVCKAWAQAWGPANVTTLRYKRPRYVEEDGVFVDVMPRRWVELAPSLVGLDLSEWDGAGAASLVEILHHLPRLVSLSLHHCDVVTAGVLNAVGGLTRLADLNLARCRPAPACQLAALSSLTALTRLDLSDCGRGHDQAWSPSSFLPHMPHLEALRMARCLGVAGDGLLALQPLSALTTLDLSHNRHTLSGKGLGSLQLLTGITSLDLSRNGVLCDEGLEALHQLEKLTYLNLSWCQAKQLSALQPLTTLSCLNLSHSWWDYASLAELQRLPALTCLNLAHCRIADDGLDTLEPLTLLRCLNLECNNFGSARLIALQQMMQLRRLNLSRCTRLSDKGLVTLHALPALKYLNLDDCPRLTNKGLAPVQHKLGKCRCICKKR